jgi:hypothetical protein
MDRFVAGELEISEEEAELWIVKLIKQANIDAKINIEDKMVIFSSSKIDINSRVNYLLF